MVACVAVVGVVVGGREGRAARRRRRRGRGDDGAVLLRGRQAAAPAGLLQRVGDVGDGEELLHVDDGRPVVAALLHGGEDVVVLAGVADGAEVDDEEVDDGVGGGELAPQPGDETVALVHEPAGGLSGPVNGHGAVGGGGDDGRGGHGLASVGAEGHRRAMRAGDLGFWQVFSPGFSCPSRGLAR